MKFDGVEVELVPEKVPGSCAGCVGMAAEGAGCDALGRGCLGTNMIWAPKKPTPEPPSKFTAKAETCPKCDRQPVGGSVVISASMELCCICPECGTEIPITVAAEPQEEE